MFNRIIVPLDGSTFAEEALTPARLLARQFNSQLLIVRAQQLPMLAGMGSDALVEDLDEADAYLHGVVSKLRSEGFTAELLLYVATPSTGITRAAALDHADLIVMTSHLRWTLPEHSPKSVTLDVLAGSRVPVLVWRAGNHEMPSRDMPIVVPLDGTPFAEAALPLAEALAKAFDSYLVLVRATEHEDEHAAVVYVRNVAADVKGEHDTPVTTVVRAGPPLSVIDRTWREHDAALIVMTSHGKRPEYKGFLGSIAASLVEEIEVPMLITQPAERDSLFQNAAAYTSPDQQAQ